MPPDPRTQSPKKEMPAGRTEPGQEAAEEADQAGAQQDLQRRRPLQNPGLDFGGPPHFPQAAYEILISRAGSFPGGSEN